VAAVSCSVAFSRAQLIFLEDDVEQPKEPILRVRRPRAASGAWLAEKMEQRVSKRPRFSSSARDWTSMIAATAGERHSPARRSIPQAQVKMPLDNRWGVPFPPQNRPKSNPLTAIDWRAKLRGPRPRH